jgi:hypothetical protein
MTDAATNQVPPAPDNATPPEEQGQRYLQLLAEWQDTQRVLSGVKDREMELRLQLFAGAFPNPTEGTNTYTLPDGRKLKGGYTINRKLVITSVAPTIALLKASGVANADQLVKYTPELAKREWNALSPESKLVFSRAIVASPGAPSLEVVPAPGM